MEISEKLFNEIVAEFKHAELFIRTREKMHPAGVELYHDLQNRLTKLPLNKGNATEACKQNPKTCQFYDGIGCAGLPTLCTGRPR